MKAALATALAAIVITASPAPAAANDANFTGVWKQTSSNAGACPSCRITIRKSGKGLAVVSNNGWSGTVLWGADGDTNYATGNGRWRPGAGGPTYSGKRISLDFNAKGNTLRMTMGLVQRAGQGAAPVINATYVRISR